MRHSITTLTLATACALIAAACTSPVDVELLGPPDSAITPGDHVPLDTLCYRLGQPGDGPVPYCGTLTHEHHTLPLSPGGN